MVAYSLSIVSGGIYSSLCDGGFNFKGSSGDLNFWIT
jgi:hypothetical protein